MVFLEISCVSNNLRELHSFVSNGSNSYPFGPPRRFIEKYGNSFNKQKLLIIEMLKLIVKFIKKKTLVLKSKILLRKYQKYHQSVLCLLLLVVGGLVEYLKSSQGSLLHIDVSNSPVRRHM